MKKLNCELITWRKSYELATKLARKIKLSSYIPEIVIAIGRGGFVPARIVSDFLNITELTSIRIEHWLAAKLKKEARLQAPLAVNAGGKKVLVVDDITDTGETLEKALRYISAQNPKEIRTAVLHHKTVSKLEPDYIAHKIKKWRWVIYPWAIYEDLSTFIVEILKEEKERSSSKILKALAENFNIRMNLRTLQLMLEELETDGKIAMKTMRGLEYWCLK